MGSTKEALTGAGGPTRVRLVLSRAGYKCDVYESSTSTGTTEDVLNNTPSTETSWSKKGATLAGRYYAQLNEEKSESSTPRDDNSPHFAFPPDTVASNEDRIDYDGSRFQLDAKTDHGHYVTFSGRKVKELDA